MGAGFSGGSVEKNPSANAGKAVSIPGLQRSPGDRSGNPFQYVCLENPMGREAWLGRVYGLQRVGYNLETKQLSRIRTRILHRKKLYTLGENTRK